MYAPKAPDCIKMCWDEPQMSKEEREAYEKRKEEQRKEEKDRNPSWLWEVYLGYSQLNVKRDIENGHELRAALRTLPSLGVYANVDGGRLDGLYLGVGSGIESLVNARAYTPAGQIYEISGDTMGLTATIGFAYAQVFVEIAGHVRYFPSLGYKLPTGMATLPSELPRSIDLTDRNNSIGYQVQINKP